MHNWIACAAINANESLMKLQSVLTPILHEPFFLSLIIVNYTKFVSCATSKGKTCIFIYAKIRKSIDITKGFRLICLNITLIYVNTLFTACSSAPRHRLEGRLMPVICLRNLPHQTTFFLYHIVKNVNLSKTQEPFWFIKYLFLGGSWVQVCKFLW